MLDDGDLVRDRAIEAGPAHGPGSPDCVAKHLRRHLAVNVTGVDAVMSVCGLDHRHGRVLGGTLRKGAGEHAEEVEGFGHSAPLWFGKYVTRERSANDAFG